MLGAMFFFPTHSFEEVLTLEWTLQSDYTTSMWESRKRKKKKKGQGSRFLPKTEASALNRGLTFPRYLGAALLICLFLFCDKREHETARE